METMYYIGLDVHERTISYRVKDGSGTIYAEGTIPATRLDLERWISVYSVSGHWLKVLNPNYTHQGHLCPAN